MGQEPKLTCASDSQMKTIHFRVVLGAWNLKEPAPLLEVFGQFMLGIPAHHSHKGSQFVSHRFPTMLQGSLVTSLRE